MRRTKPNTASISLEDEVDLYCDFAGKSGGDVLADAIKLIYRSRSVRIASQTQSKVPTDKRFNQLWGEVEYKDYPRFRKIRLPRSGDIRKQLTLAEAMTTRRSCRRFGPRTVTLAIIAKALLLAHGDRRAFNYPSRAFPSAGGLYCAETYLITGKVDGLAPGVYHYAPRVHGFHVLPHRSEAWERTRKAVGQQIGLPAGFVVESVRLAPLLSKYGRRGIRFALMEVGAAAAVFDLAATSLGLKTLWLGGFADEDVWEILGVSPMHEIEVPLLAIAVGC